MFQSHHLHFSTLEYLTGNAYIQADSSIKEEITDNKPYEVYCINGTFSYTASDIPHEYHIKNGICVSNPTLSIKIILRRQPHEIDWNSTMEISTYDIIFILDNLVFFMNFDVTSSLQENQTKIITLWTASDLTGMFKIHTFAMEFCILQPKVFDK